jgi:hypothetical protein
VPIEEKEDKQFIYTKFRVVAVSLMPQRVVAVSLMPQRVVVVFYVQ